MSKKRKIVRGVILAILLICTAFLVYSIIADPLGDHDIMFALFITAGFLALDYDKGKNNNIIVEETKK